MEFQPLVSIIVPCYNASNTLDRLVKSVLNQAYVNFELLLIDDGSSDSTNEICERYAAFDKRISVKHKSNEGVSKTRNLGIEIAKGDWITFVDADDELGENYLMDMVNCAINKKTDFIISNIYAMFNGQKKSFDLEPSSVYGAKNIKQFLTDYINHPVLKVNCSKLYKLSILNNYKVRYNPKIRLSEDALFVLEYILHIQSLSVISEASYKYYQPNNLEFKYRLSLNEAIYKCAETERALNRLEEKYKCSLSSRIEQNWHKSLSCIALDYYLNDELYDRITSLYRKHCPQYNIEIDYQCNRYLKCCYHFAYNLGLTTNERKILRSFLIKNRIHDNYKITHSMPKKIWAVILIARFGNAKLLNLISH